MVLYPNPEGSARGRGRSVRVVAGEFKGRRLHARAGRGTRPTADRVREALFSMLGDVGGARVLDLYAGSGALGIEALSRGAASAVFVERDARAVAAIERNLDAVGVEADGRAARTSCASSPRPEGPFDLVFCDPPYDSASRWPRRSRSACRRSPAEDARIVTESDKRNPLELAVPARSSSATYGDTRIAIHGR